MPFPPCFQCFSFLSLSCSFAVDYKIANFLSEESLFWLMILLPVPRFRGLILGGPNQPGPYPKKQTGKVKRKKRTSIDMAVLGRQNEIKHLSPVFLRGAEMSFKFKQRKNWGRGRGVCIIKQSGSDCGLVDHFLSSGSVRWLYPYHLRGQFPRAAHCWMFISQPCDPGRGNSVPMR